MIGKQDLTLKQDSKIYQSSDRLVLLCCGETWELTVTDVLKLLGKTD